ncbi:hypothetical protein MVEN_01052500 [Mycena venus]|uniref:Zn(2)-C6 fungal-type domain-containing protein n=1 Tax=Mycena venus TaxID=2733690 RepID=A0A8H6Y879_9AGAR|nr:hypothetical protein MVEN_01052500 [Mycena venus]
MVRNVSEPRSKPRRAQAACDICRIRKIRCDSAQMPGNRCTHCTTFSLDCTHADLIKTLTSANGYVTALESRVEKMERLLSQLLPGIDFAEQLENESEVRPLYEQHVEKLPRNDHDLVDGLNKLKLNPENQRFFGKSSGIQFVQTALSLTGIELSSLRRQIRSQSSDGIIRKEFWTPSPWLLPPPSEDIPHYTFPDRDLLPVLVELYFTEINPFWPVLHRPTFERKVADNLHLRDHRFGSTLLMVCSLGARYSDDPRVTLDCVEGDRAFHSAGWKWYNQVCVIPKHLIYKPDLYELQTVALSALYLQVLSPNALCWTQVGFGLRRAHDVGAHRRRNQEHPTAENEQWKRVFWVLLCLDWVTSTYSGRPLAMHDQDFDQDLPVECDDEYWDQNFEQPKDKPSDLSYFRSYAKLLDIQAAVVSTIYSPRKPKYLGGRPNPPTEAQCIMAFDSALNAWLNDIPEHLRWDPVRDNFLHFRQSALLYTAYYNVQILVHRPFIPAPFEASPPAALPSRSICSNAARSCVRIFDVYEQRVLTPSFNIVPVALTAGLVVLLSAWSGKKTSFACISSKELDQVHSCLRIMMAAEKRYLAAGRWADIMNRVLLYAGGSLDLLFTDRTFPTLPPSAQRGHGPLAPSNRLDPELASQWSSAFIRHSVEDFEAASDFLQATLNSRRRISEDQQPGNSVNGLAQMCDLNVPVNIDAPPFPADTMAANTDIMEMWSTTASGFDVDDWSYLMSEDLSGPQFHQFSSALPQTDPSLPSQTYLDPTEFEKLRWELSCHFL